MAGRLSFAGLSLEKKRDRRIWTASSDWVDREKVRQLHGGGNSVLEAQIPSLCRVHFIAVRIVAKDQPLSIGADFEILRRTRRRTLLQTRYLSLFRARYHTHQLNAGGLLAP